MIPQLYSQIPLELFILTSHNKTNLHIYSNFDFEWVSKFQYCAKNNIYV